MTRPSNLMLLVCEVLGPASALQSHWQYRCRTQPRVMERVLAEVKMLKQESRITKSPAAAAEFIWKEFGGSDHPDCLVEKSA